MNFSIVFCSLPTLHTVAVLVLRVSENAEELQQQMFPLVKSSR